MRLSTGLANISYRLPIITVIITLLITLCILWIYVTGPLEGDFNHFFMPAEQFGVPMQLKEHGITEQYKGPYETGWDGQFYYYIANDPLARKDTIHHIDSSAYRYQRIGLPLLAKVTSKIMGKNWVSPFVYYLTSLSLVLLAVSVAAIYFQKRQMSPFWILSWALACGTQVTQLHGLPDAAGDSLLIIAIISLVEKKTFIYLIAMTLAALTREAYIVIPFFITIAELFNFLWKNREKMINYFNLNKLTRLFYDITPQLIPLFVFATWQLFIRLKFGVAPSSQAYGVLDIPLKSAYYYFILGMKGHHPVVGTGRMAYLESIGIILFLMLLLVTTFTIVKSIKKTFKNPHASTKQPILIGMLIGFLMLICMYVCFGKIIMMHHTGYFKASCIFLFFLPFLLSIYPTHSKILLAIFLPVLTIYFNYFLWDRIHASPYIPAQNVHYVTNQPACLKQYTASIVPMSISETLPHSFFNRLLSKQKNSIIEAKIINTSKELLQPFPGKGGIDINYQWLNSNTLDIVSDGRATSLTKTLLPQQSENVPVYIHFPDRPGDYLLRLSLVQHECAWFYQVNPETAFTIRYILR